MHSATLAPHMQLPLLPAALGTPGLTRWTELRWRHLTTRWRYAHMAPRAVIGDSPLMDQIPPSGREATPNSGRERPVPNGALHERQAVGAIDEFIQALPVNRLARRGPR